MSANLLAILELYSPFDAADRVLPLPVLLNLHRGILLQPAQALAARVARGGARAEAFYLNSMDRRMSDFEFKAMVDLSMNRARHALWQIGIRDDWPVELRDMSIAFNKLPYQTPGREAIFFFEYLVGLSLDPSLYEYVELLDPYLDGLPDLLAGRYMPQATL